MPELGNGNRLLHGHVDEAAHGRVVRERVVEGPLGTGVVGRLTVVNDGLDDRMALGVGWCVVIPFQINAGENVDVLRATVAVMRSEIERPRNRQEGVRRKTGQLRTELRGVRTVIETCRRADYAKTVRRHAEAVP